MNNVKLFLLCARNEAVTDRVVGVRGKDAGLPATKPQASRAFGKVFKHSLQAPHECASRIKRPYCCVCKGVLSDAEGRFERSMS